VDHPGPASDTDLDIRSLRQFVAVAEELSFTRAAARLYVAQQAVSREIRRLERRLGRPLFVRSTRRVALTADGSHLLERARELLALHDQLLLELDASRRPIMLDLHSDGRVTGLRVLQAVRAASPELEFRGRHGGSAAAMRALEAGEIQVALGRVDRLGTVTPPWLEHAFLRWEPLAVLLPERHPLAALDAVPVRELDGVTIDVNPNDPEAPDWSDLVRQFLAFSGARATPPHAPALGPENQADHLVRQGIPILTGVDHRPVAGGVIRQLVDPVPIYAWSIAWRRGLDRRLLRTIRSAADAVADAEGWRTLPDDAWLPEPEASALRSTVHR